jgi:hypothetical protein
VACLAVQGQGGDWDKAAADYAATTGQLASCKSLTAHTVLGNILRFHQKYPSETVTLQSSGPDGGQEACDFAIDSVDVGGDGEAKPGDRITIRVRGIYFDREELTAHETTIMDTRVVTNFPADQPPVGSSDQMVFDVCVPVPESDVYPASADVTVGYRYPNTDEYSARDSLKDAFSLVAPDGTAEPGCPDPAAS